MKNVLMLSLSLCFIFSCIDLRRSENCPASFWIPVTVSPIKDVYHVGDTLTVTSKFHKMVMGLNTDGEELCLYDMTGIAWEPLTIVSRIDTIGSEYYRNAVADYFDFIEDPAYDYKVIMYSDGQSTLHGEHNFKNDSFELKYRIIAQKPGMYMHCLGSLLYSVVNHQDFPGKCNRTNFDIWYRMEGADPDNIKMLEQSPDSFINNYVLKEHPDDRFYHIGGYAFKVEP